MMKHNIFALAIAAALCVSLAACGSSSSTASTAASSAASSAPASSAVSSAASASEANSLAPKEAFTITDPMADGSYAASIGSAQDGETVYTLQLYTYDLYDATAVEALQVGDTITTHTGNGEETRDVVVESIDAADGFITINGGVEEGGMYLFSEGNAYRTLTMDDYPVFYPVGSEISLALAADVTLSDSSAEYGADPTVTTGDAAVAEAINADEVGFTCYNTSVTVKDGQIVEITHAWVP